jgi:hypothetical protein
MHACISRQFMHAPESQRSSAATCRNGITRAISKLTATLALNSAWAFQCTRQAAAFCPHHPNPVPQNAQQFQRKTKNTHKDAQKFKFNQT